MRHVLDPDVRVLDGGRVLLGGDPGRLLRLRSPVRPDALDPALVQVLATGGLAHPRPDPVAVSDVTVVVPVRDRTPELARCLAALGHDAPVVVVDDGSEDPAEVARTCRAAGARVVHRPVCGGPAAARNTGLAATTTPYVAFLDSDCVPPPGWLAALLGHLDDPSVAAVAPRVRAGAGTTLLARYAQARGPLDLGARESRVRPGTRVPYVPSAALLVRRGALPHDGFDTSLRFGEDVDLVWRLVDAGHVVRYDPRTTVRHTEPDRWPAWLRRRWAYGTSAAPLAARHGDRVAPLVLPPWPAAAVLLLLLRRPAAALAVAAVPAARLHRVLRRSGLGAGPAAGTAAVVTAQGLVAVAGGLGGAGLVVTGPVLLGLLTARRTRCAAAVALLLPPLLERRRRRPDMDPLRWTALRLLDDAAYAGGVWQGCLAGRSLVPLCPRRARPR